MTDKWYVVPAAWAFRRRAGNESEARSAVDGNDFDVEAIVGSEDALRLLLVSSDLDGDGVKSS